MQLFIDSSDPKEISQAREWGIIQGVTSNPTLISKAGPDMQGTLQQILDASPGAVLCQVIGWHDPAPLMAQAHWLHRFSDKIVVKWPMSVAGLQALQRLKVETPVGPWSQAHDILVGPHMVALLTGIKAIVSPGLNERIESRSHLKVKKEAQAGIHEGMAVFEDETRLLLAYAVGLEV